MKRDDLKLESESLGPNWSMNPIFGRSYSYPMQMQMQGSVSLPMSMTLPMQLQANGYFPNYQGAPSSGITVAYRIVMPLNSHIICRLNIFETRFRYSR